jgi:hypothetical protein
MIKINIFILQTTLFTLIASACTNSLSCFKTKLFNFDSPPSEYYQNVTMFANYTTNQIVASAYGDFNNDLMYLYN